jgi:acetolactate synthase-1/2/3 large subunit
VKSADEIPQVVSGAFYIATHGKPGTVVIDLPINVQKELTNAISPERISLRAFHPECAASDRSIALLAKFINESKRPVVYAGGGVIISGASDDLRALSTKAEIPVATTLMGIGSIEVENNLCLGMAGVYGTKVANAALSKADLIIALGTRFNDRITKVFKPSKNVKIVHIDCDPSSIEKNIPVTLGIVADIKDVLTTVASRIKKNSHSKWIDALVKYSSDKPSSYDVLHKGVIMPQAVIDSIAKATRNECILVTDVGQHQMFAARRFPHARPRSFISSGGMGTMGFGIPAAIGAAFAKRDEKVVAVLGDGGAQMTAQELLVAADENLPITFVVFNNSSLGLIRQMQDQYFVGKFTNPDFTKLAAAYGIASYRVSDPGKLDEVMAKAIRAKKPVLLEVIIDCDAKV